METFQQSTTTRHEYRMKGWKKGFLLVFGSLAVALGGFITVYNIPDRVETSPPSLPESSFLQRASIG